MAIHKVIGTLLFLLSGQLMATDVYIWKDEQGISHYSQYPPEGVQAERRIISEPGKHANSSSQRRQPPRKPSTIPPSNKQELDRVAQQYCNRAQFNHNVLLTNNKVRLTDDKGVNRVLSDREKQQQLELAKRQMELFCASDAATGEKS